MRKHFWIPVLAMLAMLVVALASTGCTEADFTKTSYRALATAGAVYSATMKSAAEADRQGLLKPELKSALITQAELFYVSYHAATEAMEVYMVAKDKPDAKTKVMAALARMRADYGKLQDLAALALPAFKRTPLEVK